MFRSLFAFLVVVCVLGFARTSSAQQISGGIKAGVTSARLPGVTEAIEIPVDQEARWGGTVGAFVTLRINDLVAFQPEALYIFKGAAIASPAASYSLTFDTRYLEVPLLFRLASSRQRLYFLAGPHFSFLLSAEGTETIGGKSETRDVKDQFKGADAGISFGAGASFNRFLIEGRWSEGVRDIDREDRSDTKVRNRVLAVLAGFRFD